MSSVARAVPAPETASAARSSKLVRAAPFLLLIGAAGVVYLNALANGFALDDTAIIRDNRNVHDLSDWRSIWLKPYWPYFGAEMGLWRPLAIFAYAVQWAIGGGDPVVFHAVNIALHITVTVLTFLLLARLTSRAGALAGALLFATHPLHTEAVANIVGQAELIAGAAMIGACLLHAARPPGMVLSWPRRVGLVALFTIALLTKEHAVVLPGLLLAVDLAQRRIPLSRRGVADYMHAVLMPLLMLGCVLAAYLIVRLTVLEGSLTGTDAGPQYAYLHGEYRVLNALRAFPEFLRLLVFPLDLAADYAPAMVLPVEGMTLMTAIGAVLLAAAVVLTLLTPLRPAAGFPAAWFLIGIITVSNLLFPIGVFIAERTLYLPSMALSAAVAYAWTYRWPRVSPAGHRIAVGLLAACVILFGARTWIRNPDWKDTPTILFSLLRDHPESYKAQWTHATWQWQLGRDDVARYHYELATRLYARDSQLLSEFANFLILHGELDRAVALLETAYAMHPYVPRTILLLANAYLQAGRHADALALARAADLHGIHAVTTAPLRAAAYDGLGRTGEAVGAWRFSIRYSLLPAPAGWAYVARRLAQLGYRDEALAAAARGREAAAADTVVTAGLLRVENAVRAGCYDGAEAGESRACDPLEGRGGVVRSLQSATELQNAMTPASAAVDTARAQE